MKVRDKRLQELADLLNDSEHTEVGPLDRTDARQAICELIERRRADPPKPAKRAHDGEREPHKAFTRRERTNGDIP